MFDTRARALLEIEKRWTGKNPERKLLEMERTVGLGEFEYYAEIERVAELREAQLFDPLTVKRIKADARDRLRRWYSPRPATAWRRRSVESHPATAHVSGSTANSARGATSMGSVASAEADGGADVAATIIVWTGRRSDVASPASTATGR